MGTIRTVLKVVAHISIFYNCRYEKVCIKIGVSIRKLLAQYSDVLTNKLVKNSKVWIILTVPLYYYYLHIFGIIIMVDMTMQYCFVRKYYQRL